MCTLWGGRRLTGLLWNQGPVLGGGGLSLAQPAAEGLPTTTAEGSTLSHRPTRLTRVTSARGGGRGLAPPAKQAPRRCKPDAGASPGARAPAASPTWHIPRGSSCTFGREIRPRCLEQTGLSPENHCTEQVFLHDCARLCLSLLRITPPPQNH